MSDWFEDEKGKEHPKLTELEEELGDDADAVPLLGRGDLHRLHHPPAGGTGAKKLGTKPKPDLSRPGDMGDVRSFPSKEFPRTRNLFVNPDGSWSSFGKPVGPDDCGKVWILTTEYFQAAPGACAGVKSYQPFYRAALLLSVAEAYRLCSRTRCERALLWIQSAGWSCYMEKTTPTIYMHFDFAVICTAG